MFTVIYWGGDKSYFAQDGGGHDPPPPPPPGFLPMLITAAHLQKLFLLNLNLNEKKNRLHNINHSS